MTEQADQGSTRRGGGAPVLAGVALVAVAAGAMVLVERSAADHARRVDEIADGVTDADSDLIDSDDAGKPVLLQGRLTSGESVVDPETNLRVGGLRLRRRVESFEPGDKPDADTWIAVDDGAEDLGPKTFDAAGVHLGAWEIAPSTLSRVGAFEPLAPEAGAAETLSFDGRGAQVSGRCYVFLATAEETRLRACYEVVPNGVEVTMLGAQQHNGLGPWPDDAGETHPPVLVVGEADADDLVELAIPGSPMLWWIVRFGAIVGIFGGLFVVLRRLVGRRVPGLGTLTHAIRPAVTLTVPVFLVSFGAGSLVAQPILGAVAFVLAGGTFVAALVTERALLQKKAEKGDALPTPPAPGA